MSHNPAPRSTAAPSEQIQIWVTILLTKLHLVSLVSVLVQKKKTNSVFSASISPLLYSFHAASLFARYYSSTIVFYNNLLANVGPYLAF